jgi:nucleotide-binding universal stress UspA family protein
MKLIIGVDGSEGSLRAVDMASRLADAPRDQVGLYFSPPEVLIRDSGRYTDEARRRVRGVLAESVFERAKARLAEPLRQNVHTIVGEQPPRQGLVAAAEVWRADAIALGARGAAPLTELLLGSVATSVVHASPIPVVVARQRPADRGNRPLKVLLAVDASDAGQQAAQALTLFSWPAGTEGRVVSVIEPLFVGAVPDWLHSQTRDPEVQAMAAAWKREHEGERQRRLDELVALRGTLPTAFQSADPIVAEGHPAEQILRLIDEQAIDLVVVGAVGKSAWQRLLLGSTSEALLNQAPCSVMVVRRHAQP